MNITIDLNNLDEGIKQVEDLIKKIEFFTADLAEETRSSVGYDNVSVHHNGEGSHTVIASGDQIAFAEWGAGYVADYVSGFQHLGGDAFLTYPGVWSKDHKRTFQFHRMSGKSPETYKYNREPLRKMETAAIRLQSTAAQRAKEYFK